MKIREITTFDSESLRVTQQLLDQLSARHREFTREQFEAVIGSTNSHLLHIYDQDDRAVGMLTIGIYPTPSGVRAWVEDVTVNESVRGQGYGRALVLFAIDLAHELGADTLSLTSAPTRIAANKLYQSLGFELRHTNAYKMDLKGR